MPIPAVARQIGVSLPYYYAPSGYRGMAVSNHHGWPIAPWVIIAAWGIKVYVYRLEAEVALPYSILLDVPMSSKTPNYCM